jgi:molecular chaperone DnaJ
VAPQREWFEKDYYKILGVPETADAKEITRAYRKLARTLHPDANPGDPTAEDRFKEVSAAYDVLGDETRRAEYDQVRRMGPVGGGFGGGFGPGGFGGAGGPQVRVEDLGDLGDLFGGLFGRGGRGRQARGTGPQRGADLEAELTLSFSDAAHGLTTGLHLTSDAACSTCHGTGARPGTAPQICTVCGGRGVLDENQGFFSFSQPCTTCAGRGTVITDPCETCRGSGVVRRDREVKVRIPAGVDDGQRIRLKGRGAAGRNGGPPGDLYVHVHVLAHPIFGRDGDNVTISVPITFAEAALGAAITVPTLDGGPVTIKVPPGTRSGRTLRVRGRGIENAGRRGDLLVTVDIDVPSDPTPDQRRAIEAFAAASDVSPRSHLGV